jgi:hypothetical protein
MSVKEIFDEMEQKIGVSTYQLGKMLGFKSPSHIYRLKNGIRTPNIQNANKIIRLAKKVGMDITLEMFD